MKICCNKECKQVNPQNPGAFNKDRHSKDGLKSRCRVCLKAYKKERYSLDPKKQYKYNLKYRKAHPERRVESQRAYREKQKAKNEQD